MDAAQVVHDFVGLRVVPTLASDAREQGLGSIQIGLARRIVAVKITDAAIGGPAVEPNEVVTTGAVETCG